MQRLFSLIWTSITTLEYTFKTKRNKYKFLLFKIVGFYCICSHFYNFIFETFPPQVEFFPIYRLYFLQRQNWMPALEGWRRRHVLPDPPRCVDTFSRLRALVTLPVNSFECLFMTRPTEEKPGTEKRKLVHMVFLTVAISFLQQCTYTLGCHIMQ